MAKGKGKRKSTPTPAPALFPEITHPGKRAFLTAFVTSASRQKAAEACGMDVRNHWFWLAKDEAYAEAFARAVRLAADSLEDKLIDLAMQGYEEGVWFKGQLIGKERRYLPTLLQQAVNAALPEKYKYRVDATHGISPAFAALQAEWLKQVDHPEVTRRELPPAGDIINMEPEGEEPRTPVRPSPGAPTKREVFQLLDKLNSIPDEPDGEWDEAGAEELEEPEPPVKAPPPPEPQRPSGYDWPGWKRSTP
jgi:hypothetical protein